MKILSLNTGYFLGYTGTPTHYALHPGRAVIGRRHETRAIDEFVTLVYDTEPDIVLLQEVDTGSIRTRTRGQMQYIAQRCLDDYTAHTARKYGNTVIARLPMLRHMANGVLYRQGSVKDYYLDRGVKSLVQEVQVDDVSVFSVHLARFGTWARKHQLQELCCLAADREHSIIVGDFNALTGTAEADILRERAGFSIACPGSTFPARRPAYPLDFAAASSDLSIQCTKLDNTISDHAPILVTVDEHVSDERAEQTVEQLVTDE